MKINKILKLFFAILLSFSSVYASEIISFKAGVNIDECNPFCSDRNIILEEVNLNYDGVFVTHIREFVVNNEVLSVEIGVNHSVDYGYVFSLMAGTPNKNNWAKIGSFVVKDLTNLGNIIFYGKEYEISGKKIRPTIELNH